MLLGAGRSLHDGVIHVKAHRGPVEGTAQSLVHLGSAGVTGNFWVVCHQQRPLPKDFWKDYLRDVITPRSMEQVTPLVFEEGLLPARFDAGSNFAAEVIFFLRGYYLLMREG